MNLLLSERQASALARALRVLRDRQRPPTLCAAAVECRALSLPALMPTKRAAPKAKVNLLPGALRNHL